MRALREQAGKTQLWVEVEANLGTGYLQRVESGRVAQPGHGTVERILDALGVRFGERRDVFQLYGYSIATPQPTDDDIAWARGVCRRELHEVAFPAYVIDCTLRLTDWNRYLPQLFGLGPNDPIPRQLRSGSFLAAWFDPASPLATIVAEPSEFLPALVRAFRYETRLVLSESWYRNLLNDLLSVPKFRLTWDEVDREEPPVSAARSLVPLRLQIPGIGPLLFRISAEPFLRDPRFRLIYYFPADPATMNQCAAWSGTHSG
jgi:transcriptional regulator with XRE-family HTH domain